MRQGYNKGTMTDRAEYDSRTTKAGKHDCCIIYSCIDCTYGSLFDYYYNLNDDMLMKDIVSGLYTGNVTNSVTSFNFFNQSNFRI